MNVKTTITLSERHLRYAEKMVEDGAYPSVSSVIEAGLDQMILGEDTDGDPVTAMADEIRRRAELPRDQWLAWDGEGMAAKLKEKLNAKYGK